MEWWTTGIPHWTPDAGSRTRPSMGFDVEAYGEVGRGRDPTAGSTRGAADVLDERQRGAAEATADRVAVVAGAGAGKTRVLAARASALVERGVPGSRILVLTFTNRAATEVRDRIRIATGLGDDGPVVTTCHSWGARFLRLHGGRVGLGRDYAIVDMEDVRPALVRAAAEVGLATDKATVASLSQMVARWKTWGLRTSDVPDDPDRTDRRELDAYVRYGEILREGNHADLGDLVLSPVEILSSDPALRAGMSGRIEHLLVDEAQDLNPAQVWLVRLLSARHKRVFAVGDPNQSIFRFQGGGAEALETLVGPGAERLRLARNHRTTVPIAACASALVGRNPGSPGDLECDVPGRPVIVRRYADDKREAEAVASAVAREIRDGTPPSEVAVLVRADWVSPPLEEALAAAGVPYRKTHGTPFSQRKGVKDVMAYVRLGVSPTDALAFDRIHNVPARGVGPATYKALTEALGGRDYVEACLEPRVANIRPAAREGLSALGRVLDTLVGMVRDGRTSTELVDEILDGPLGYAHRWREAAPAFEREVSLLRTLARHRSDPVALLEEVAIMDQVDTETGAVTLATVHTAKGLEWDSVYLPAFDGSVFPSPKSLKVKERGTFGDPLDGPDGGGVEEERRLGYVAFTRARRSLHVSYPMVRHGNPVSPSRFLSESGLSDPGAFESGWGEAIPKGR